MKSIRQIIFFIFICVLLCACSFPQPIKDMPNAPKAWVTFGPEIEIINQPPKRYAWAIDQKGNAHFIVEISDSKELQYVIVGQDGVLEKSIMNKAKDIPWYSLNKKNYMDAAFDKSGNLHLIRDGEHFAYKEKMWEEQPTIPCLQFAKGWKDLICGYVAGGMELDSPGRLDWYMIAGYGGGLIWPWYSYPDKLVVVKKNDDSWFKPVVVDSDTKQDIAGYSLAADEKGNLYALYTRKRLNLLGLSFSYIPKNFTETTSIIASKDSTEDRIAKVSGESMTGSDNNILPSGIYTYYHKIAVDPVSGIAMLASENPKKLYLIKDGKLKKALDAELVSTAYVGPAAAGDGQFHVIIWGITDIRGITGVPHVDFYYLICKETGCSAPILLGEGYGYNIISDGKGNALLAMRSKEQPFIVKWIRVNK